VTVENIAHRGASLTAPENTLAAFEQAIRHGADRMELDVQLDADGTPVIHHDATLERVTDVARRHPDRAPWDLRTFRTAELAQLDATWPAATEGEPTGLATLDDVLRELAGRTRLLLELKDPARHPELVPATLEVLDRHPWWLAADHPDRMTLQSFDHDAVRRVRAQLPDHLPFGWLFDEGVVPPIAELPDWVRDVVVDHRSVTAELVAAAHGHGRRVLAWTVNDEPRLGQLVDLGVDGIITDDPALLTDVLADRQERIGAGRD